MSHVILSYPDWITNSVTLFYFIKQHCASDQAWLPLLVRSTIICITFSGDET